MWKALLILLVGLLTASLSAGQEVRVRLNPKVSLAPAVINATVIIERHPDNRAIAFFWADEASEISSSSEELNEKSDSSWSKVSPRLGPGEYAFVVILRRVDPNDRGKFKDYQVVERFTVGGGQ